MRKIIVTLSLFLMSACSSGNGAKANEPALTQPPEPEQTATPTPYATPAVTVLEETPSPSPSPTEDMVAASPTPDKPLSLDGWVVGQSFSDVKDRIAEDAQVEYETEEGQYAILFDQTGLLFDHAGRLKSIVLEANGKGLSYGLNVGDAESSIISVLGNPMKQSNGEDYHAYLYATMDSEFYIYARNDKIVNIQLKDTGSGVENREDDSAAIEAFYQQQAGTGIASSPSPESSPSPSPAADEEKPKLIAFEEYVQISEELLNALVQYTQAMSKDITDEDKLKQLNHIDKTYQIFDRSAMFDDAEPADEQDRDLHNRCKYFVQQLDSLFGTGEFYLNLKINQEDEQTISGWKQQEMQEQQALWAWVNGG